MTRALLALTLLSAAAASCDRSGSAHASLLGEYRLTALDGGPLPAPSPDLPGVQVLSLALRLDGDRFELGSTFRTPGDSVQTAPALTGRWERTEDELRFFPEQTSDTVRFGLEGSGEGLVLTDENGHEWTMQPVDGKGNDPGVADSPAASPACRSAEADLFIDHVIFVVTDLDAAAEAYRTRGFTVKPGRRHPDGLVNAHVKLPSAQEIELMSLEGDPSSEIADAYAQILRDGEGGAYLALAVPDLDEAERTARGVGLRTATPSSGAARFVSFPADSAATAVFFGARSQIIDPDSLLTHANGAAALEEVWIEGGETLASLLEALGAVRCGEAVRGSRSGQRFGVANGEVVVVPRSAGKRARMLGGRVAGVAAAGGWLGIE